MTDDESSRLSGVLPIAAVALLAVACGGDMTGPNGSGTVGLDLSVGESSVVQGTSDGLSFTLPGPSSSGAAYRLAVQSASRSGTGAIPMQLRVDAGSTSSSSSMASADLRSGDSWSVREISRDRMGLELRTRLQREARSMLLRKGIRPSSGYSPGVARASMLPTGEIPQQGDTLRFWLPVSDKLSVDCDTTDASKITGVVRAVGEKVALVEDSAADLTPTQRMNMEYQALADEFDETVFGTNVAYFGDPTDIDGNQRVLVVLTTRVNEISAAQQGEGLLGGFFLPTDLSDSGDDGKDGAPATFGGQADSDPNDDVCDASNEAEVMWLIAPDPDGSTGEELSVPDARRQARSTSSHEFQHMLNAGNRFVGNGSFADGEMTWLNEGLSHIAEETVGLKSTGKTLRQNLTAQDVLGNSEEVDAFNTFLAADFHNAAQFLDDPNSTRALAFSDTTDIPESLKMRGFGWIFLRWLADQEAPATGGSADGLPGSGEELMFRALAGADGSLEVGVENIEAFTGKEWDSLLADFGLAVAVDDDVAAVPDRLQVTTWDLRSVYSELHRQDGQDPFDQPYPLTITPQGFSTGSFNFEVKPGGGRYFVIRSSSSGSQVRVEVTDHSGQPLTTGNPQVTIVRVR